jgi:predicted TIM-barrel fold metal-dependent hydrolase
MGKEAIISIDGHVKGSRRAYRDYVPKKFLDVYDEQVKAAEETGLRDAGNIHPEFEPEVQWNSEVRIKNLESVGVVAEVLFSNGQPFQINRLDDSANSANEELGEVGRQVYNRWLVDFCAEAPGRRKGQLAMSFDDIDQTVKEIYWAKENGLGGVRLPGLSRDGLFFFDPALDPVWAACVETGFVVSQHGGAADPNQPMGTEGGGFRRGPGFGAFLMISTENAFFSNRSLWMMIAGGVFDRFPELKATWIETQVHFMVPIITNLDKVLESDWMGQLGVKPTLKRLPTEYFGTNIRVGVSPFSTRADPGANVLGLDSEGNVQPGFRLGPQAAMWGTDYPHFESNLMQSWGELAKLATTPGLSDEDIHNMVFGNAAEHYGFDVEALQPHIDRVGFELDEVRENAESHIAGMVEPINLIKDGGGALGSLFGARRQAAPAGAASQ